MALENSSDIAKAMGVQNGPSLYLNDKQYGSIGDLKVGEEVSWTIKGIVQDVSAHGPYMAGGKGHANATINVTSIDGKDATVAPTKKGSDTIAPMDYDEDD